VKRSFIYSRCAFAATILLFLVANPAASQDAAQTKSSAEDDIREAVIRSQMEQRLRNHDQRQKKTKNSNEKATEGERNLPVFYVSINGKDPSDAFMERFLNIPGTVKKVSSSKIDEQRMNAVIDKSTGQPGIIFRADEVRWLGENSVEVNGGYFCGGLCAAAITLKLEREEGKWIVKSSITRAIA
jgi:hypothetical protein